MKLENLEYNIKKSFQGVKKDIAEVKDQLNTLKSKLESLEANFEESKKKVNNHKPEAVQPAGNLVQIRETNETKKERKKNPVNKKIDKAKRVIKARRKNKDININIS